MKGRPKFKKGGGKKVGGAGGGGAIKRGPGKKMLKGEKNKKRKRKNNETSQKNKATVPANREKNDKKKLQNNESTPSIKKAKSESFFVTIFGHALARLLILVVTAVKTSLTRKELDKKKLSHRRQRKLPADSLERIDKAKQIWEHVRRWVWSAVIKSYKHFIDTT